MGESSLSLLKLELDKPTEQILSLVETGKSEYLGQISMTLRLEPKQPADRSSSIVSNLSSSVRDGSVGGGGTGGRGSDGMAAVAAAAVATKRCRSSGAAWSAVVNVVLIEGKELLAMDFEGTSDPYCKFR